MNIFSHESNTQKVNTNAIFTSEKLDKSDDLVDIEQKLTVNDAKYYESKTVTASDAQGDLTRNLETVTHTSNKNKTVTNTSNGNFEQKLLSNRTIPVVVPKMNPRIDQIIATSLVVPQALFTPLTKEVVVDMVPVCDWVNWAPQQVIRTGADGNTPGDICNTGSVKNSPSPVLIGIVATSPPRGRDASL